MSKALFLRPVRLRTERFPLPELGDDAHLILRELPSKALLALRQKHGSTASGLQFAIDFLSEVLIDEAGQPLFASAEECQEHLTALPMSVLDRLLLAALQVCGLEGQQTDDGPPAKN